MDRFVDWGHWAIHFWNGHRNQADAQCVAVLYFPTSATGPMDGTLGSPERSSYKHICQQWVQSSVLPDGALCEVDQAWLYDPACPDARWDCDRWVSPVKLNGHWTFP